MIGHSCRSKNNIIASRNSLVRNLESMRIFDGLQCKEQNLVKYFSELIFSFLKRLENIRLLSFQRDPAIKVLEEVCLQHDLDELFLVYNPVPVLVRLLHHVLKVRLGQLDARLIAGLCQVVQ